MEDPMGNSPTLIDIDGRAFWQWPDGKTLPFIHGGEGPLPEAPPAPAPTQAAPPQYVPAQVEGLPPNYNGSIYTEEELHRRLQERESQTRDRYYAEREAERAELARLRAEAEQRAAAEQEAEAQRKAAEEEARRKAEIEEMDAKTAFERYRQEFEAQREADRQRFEAELARRDAIMEQERRYQQVEAYRLRVVSENADQILPELADLVTGSTEEEINASLARMIERTQSVLANLHAAGQPAPADTRTVSPFAPAMGPESFSPTQRPISAEELAALPASEWAKVRSQFVPAGRPGERGMWS